MASKVRVIQGRLAEVEPHRTSAIEAAYQHFRLDRQGSLASPKTLRHYEWMIRPFLRWLSSERPGVDRFERLDVDLVGYHRALGFLLQGITRVPVFVRDVPVTENLAPVGMLPEQSYLGTKPLQLSDYLDDDVSRDVTLPASQKLIVIEGLELSLAS